MKLKKVLASGLVTALVIASLSACGNTEEQKENGSKAETSSKTETKESASAEGSSETVEEKNWWDPYEETVTVKLGRDVDVNKQWPEGETYSDNAYWNWIEETLNIEFADDYLMEKSQFNTQLPLWLASGELPDIVYAKDDILAQQCLESGYFQDITDELNEYGSDVFWAMVNAAPYPDELFDKVSKDGKIYGTIALTAGYHYNMAWIRGDWLEELNLEVPTNVTEVLEVAKRFVEEDMAGDGNTVGIEVGTLVGGVSASMTTVGLFHSMGAFPQSWYDDGTGNYVYGSIQPEVKDVLALFRDLYAEGVLPKDLGSHDTGTSLAAGNGGVYFAPWWNVNAASLENDPDAMWISVPLITEDDGIFHTVENIPTAGGYLFVNKDFEYPEIAVKLSNICCEMRLNNSDGCQLLPTDDFNLIIPDEVEQHYIKDGWDPGWYTWPVPYADNFYDMCLRIADNVTKDIEDYKAGKTDGMLPAELNKVKLILGYEDGTDTSRAARQQYAIYQAELQMKDLKEKGLEDYKKAYYPVTTKTMETNWSSLRDLEDKAFLQIILGEQPLDYFDTFVAEWKAQGGDVISAEITEQANK